jgi:lipoprotein-anchoring transpeptidase ErfK/SrfK
MEQAIARGFSMPGVRLIVLVVVALVIAFPAGAEVLITVDKSIQRMVVMVDGSVRWIWPVSTGRRGYETPDGSYTVFWLDEDHYSEEWDDAPMPHSIFFTKRGHAIHGSYETKRLGTPMSHGCVRLHPANAAMLYALVEKMGLAQATVVITRGDD